MTVLRAPGQKTAIDLARELLGDDLPVGVRSYDGAVLGPPDPPATIVVRSQDALNRLLTAPGELGFARAYVAGDLDLEGDVYEVLALRDRLPAPRLSARQWVDVLRMVADAGLKRLPPPPEEVHLSGRRHSKARDRAAIAHHYDVSNAFYRMILGPTMTYSCAVFSDRATSLDDAQVQKYELVSTKLGLRPGMRLLDVGCGWGGMVMHAAEHHGVRAVGVTLSERQAELAEERVARAGLSDRVEVRLQDYRDVDDGPFDAISSIGMFEHVGVSQQHAYFSRMHDLLRPEGRFLNHAICRPAGPQPRFAKRSFIEHYVFPDGELHEVGQMISNIQETGFECRHSETLREHYALTLRAWVRNLDEHWDKAVAEVGPGRARVWRLYMAASALNFEAARTQIHQVLAVKVGDRGESGLPLRPRFTERVSG